MSSLADRFASLFAGRTDAYGRTHPNGHVECAREIQGVPIRQISPLKIMETHLAGTADFGVYPMVPRWTAGPRSDFPDPEWYVKWVCVDLDIAAPGKRRYDFDSTLDAQTAADRLVVRAEREHVWLWPEITKSGGVHVWGFLHDWTEASIARNAMLWLCGEANVPTTEVNPKQTSMSSPDQLGNFVRVPFFGGVAINDMEPTARAQRPIRMPVTWERLEVEEFLDAAEQTLIASDKMRELASRYVPPMAPSPMPYVGEPIEVDKDWIKNLPPLLKSILKGGMGRSHDRSSWLYYLACTCSEEGLSPEDALAFVEVADALHSTKYQNRPDADERYRELVERAYS